MERRISPRVEWHGPVSYRSSDEEDYRTGFLANISTTGAMLWLDTELGEGDDLEVVMQSEYDPEPVHMKMRVRRALPEKRNGYRGYGCTLELHEPWENECPPRAGMCCLSRRRPPWPHPPPRPSRWAPACD